MDTRRYEELKATGKLPSPSGVALAIVKLLQRDDYHIEELSHLVQSDPAIAGRILKFANTALQGTLTHSRPIVSLSKAVFALGAFRVRDLVLGFSVLHSHQNVSCGNFDLQLFWSRSLATAIANQALAPHAKIAPEENFTVGLLSGIGELAMAALFQEEYTDLQAQENTLEQEQQLFDTDHRELTATLLTEWGLPEVLVRVAYFHERPETAEFSDGSRYQLLTLSLHFSRRLADICLADEQQRWSKLMELVTLAARLGIGPDELTTLADQVVTEWQEWGKALQIETHQLPPFADLLTSSPPIPQQPRQMRADRFIILPKMLLVGSESDGAASAQRLLDNTAWDIKLADGSKDGLVVALREQPQIIIADLNTPGLNAIQFCQNLRKSQLGRDVFVIIVADPSDEPLLRRAVDAGADDFMLKPLRVHALDMRLRNAQRMITLREEIRHERRGIMISADRWAGEHRRLMQTAMTDPLTKLPNRRHGEDFLASEWTSAQHSGLPLSCLMFDIDHFKHINDHYGHEAGDAVLSQLGTLLKQCLRSEDLAFRYGGEEFAVICPGTPLKVAMYIGERVRASVEQNTFSYQQTNIPVTISVGVSVSRPELQDYKDLQRAADHALYKAKQGGRNRVES